MESPTREELLRCYSELADFCFRKLMHLEARFVMLCHRAQAAGIDCEDLHDFRVVSADPGAPRAAN